MWIHLIIIVLAFICWAFPWWFQILLFVGNFFLPDPTPFLDELIQFIGIFNTLFGKKG